MTWFYLALSSISFFAVLNLVQRRVAVNSKYQRAAAVVFNLFGAAFAIIIFFVTGGFVNFKLPSNITAWIFMLFAMLFYGLFERGRFVAAKLLDASTLTIINNVSLAVAFIGSIFLYSEPLTVSKIAGVLLIILSLILISSEKNIHKKVSLKGVGIAVVIFTFLGIAWMLDKKGAIFFTPSIYNLFGWTIPLIFIYFPKVRGSEIVHEFKIGSWKFALMGALNVVGYYLQLKALTLTDATRVIPIVQTSTLLTVILGILILGERDFIWRKIVAAFIAIAGVFLLSAI